MNRVLNSLKFVKILFVKFSEAFSDHRTDCGELRGETRQMALCSIKKGEKYRPCEGSGTWDKM